jgi:hypothetical protein
MDWLNSFPQRDTPTTPPAIKQFQQLNNSSMNLKDMKKQLATRPEFMRSRSNNTPSEKKHEASVRRLFSDRRTSTDPSRRPLDATPKSLPGMPGVALETSRL